MLLDALRAASQQTIPRIIDIKVIGKGLYHLELADEAFVQNLLHRNPIELNGMTAFFSEWSPEFSIEAIIDERGSLFPIVVVFPNSPKEYVSFLKDVVAGGENVMNSRNNAMNFGEDIVRVSVQIGVIVWV